MLVITVSEIAGDPRARIFFSTVNPYSIKQIEDMVEERFKKEAETRKKAISDDKISRSSNPKNLDFVPKFQDNPVRRSPLKYWRRTYRNISDLQILEEHRDTCHMDRDS